MVKLRWYVLLGATVSVGLATLLYARHLDVTHGTAVLTYDLDTASEAWFSRLLAAFKEFASCDRVWHIREKGSIEDWKRNAGATSRLSRRAIVPALSLPRRVRCNLEVPSLEAGSQTLYLFPDRMLVYEGSSVGAVPYSQLTTSVPDSLFHEDETVPSDSKRVGTTWQYVNKDGGPDRRFNNNTQIPVMRYGNIHFTSSTGLNELFQCSRPEAGRRLTAALRVSPAGHETDDQQENHQGAEIDESSRCCYLGARRRRALLTAALGFALVDTHSAGSTTQGIPAERDRMTRVTRSCGFYATVEGLRGEHSADPCQPYHDPFASTAACAFAGCRSSFNINNDPATSFTAATTVYCRYA
jgi:hypothetical protein